MTKREAIELLENIEIKYPYADTYREIVDAVWEIDDSLGNTHQIDLYDVLMEEDIYDASDSILDDIVAREVSMGGIDRLYYFMGDWTPNSELAKINAYGNLTTVDADTLETIIDSLLYELERLEDTEDTEDTWNTWEEE